MHEGRFLEIFLQPDGVQDTWKMPWTDCTDQSLWQPIPTGQNNQHMDNGSGGEPFFVIIGLTVALMKIMLLNWDIETAVL